MKAKTASSRLLTKKPPSLDTNDARRGDVATRWERMENRVKEPTRTSTKKPSKAGPMADWVKEWTELIVPDRVRRVPRMVRENAEITNTRSQAWSMPLLC